MSSAMSFEEFANTTDPQMTQIPQIKPETILLPEPGRGGFPQTLHIIEATDAVV
jgi:hypothetical protein